MKRVLITLCGLLISISFIFSQTTGKVVYGPGAESTVHQDLSVIAGEGQTVIYSEATKTGSGYEPSQGGPSPSNAPIGAQFTAYVLSNTPNSFTVRVTDAPDCAGTYTINCNPIAGSGPGGTNPPLTTIIAYIGFPQGDFYFGDAGNGEYLITVTNTNIACLPPVNPVSFHAWPSVYTPIIVPILAQVDNMVPPSIPFTFPGYTADGHFYIKVTDTPTCSGTYTIWCNPVPNSAPDGTTPPMTVIIGYIGFPAGSFLFQNAGVGLYHVSVTQTNINDICNYTENPLEFDVQVPDSGTTIPVSNYAIGIGIALIVLLAVWKFRKLA